MFSLIVSLPAPSSAPSLAPKRGVAKGERAKGCL